MTHPDSSKRLISLDAFRGATIVAMILVNNPGTWQAVYPQLRHAEWNGWTFTDTIFPFFLFIVGVSIVFSFAQRREKGDTHTQLARQVVRRTLIIFGLGLFLSAFPIFHLSTLRIPGVLQRIALCYFAAAVIVLRTGIKGQVCWLVGLLLSYWLMMQFIPVPGIGAGVYEQGRNFASYVDSLFLSGHMWSKYETWDPEGIISTIPAIGTTLFGVLAGHWLRSTYWSREKKALWLAVAGAILLLVGQVLDRWLPINKNIWTSTFAIFMAGWAAVWLSLFYWLIDVKGFKRWATPFVIYGSNALTAYVLSQLIDTSLRFVRVAHDGNPSISVRSFVFRSFYSKLASPMSASLLFAVTFVLAVFLIMWFMWRNRWFLKI